jgi:hypothetical protein
MLGMELNPRAAAIADVVLRIIYLPGSTYAPHGLTQLSDSI